jgi:tetratricopeptide (TPR) repeat protein
MLATQDADRPAPFGGMTEATVVSLQTSGASSLLSAGRLDEAIEQLEPAVAWRREVGGDNHPETLISRFNLAAAYSRAGRLDEAESEARDILFAAQGLGEGGVDHPLVRHTRSLLATVLTSRGDRASLREAADVAMDNVATQRDQDDGGVGLPLAINTQATILLSLGETEQAEASLAEAKRLLIERIGEDHPFTLTVRGNHAATLANLGRHEEALPEAKQLVERLRKSGESRANLATALDDLGYIQLQAGYVDEATASLREAVAMAEAGKFATSLPHFLYNLGDALNKAGELTEAQTVLRRSWDLQPLPETANLLADLLEGSGESHAAAIWRAKAAELEASDDEDEQAQGTD